MARYRKIAFSTLLGLRVSGALHTLIARLSCCSFSKWKLRRRLFTGNKLILTERTSQHDGLILIALTLAGYVYIINIDRLWVRFLQAWQS
ncbi:hypothetical protein MNBD_GAMMA13-1134, partial [hydrothermal vent metagenome]